MVTAAIVVIWSPQTEALQPSPPCLSCAGHKCQLVTLPPLGQLHAGEYQLLRVANFQVVYMVEHDLVTVRRVDRIAV
jgi:hypothetical protein